MSAEQLVDLMKKNLFIIEYGSQSDHREYAEELWEQMASQLNMTVSACKCLWDSIINDYKKYLEPSMDGLPKTPWYLSEKMSYFIPYISIPAANIEEKKNGPKKETTPVKFQKDNGEEIEDARTTYFRRHKVKRLEKEKDGGMPALIQNKSKVDFSRRMFLLSLLPDVEKLNEKQLDEFRLNMLLLVEKIKYTDC